jgi:hypothetical protein
MKNALEDMYETYREHYEPRLIKEDCERNAFVNGFIAAMSVFDIDPEEVYSEVTGKTVSEEVDELVKWIDETN